MLLHLPSLAVETTYTESELVEKLKLRDEKAFHFLYENYSKSLFNIIIQRIPDQDVSEDVLQQVFVKIWKNIDQYNSSKGRLYTWMLNITRNQSTDFIRSKEFNNSGKTISLTDNVYDKVETAYTIRDTGLTKLVEELPTESRKLLQLSYFMGYTQEDISKILEIPLGTVKTRLRTIILQLRKKMFKQ